MPSTQAVGRVRVEVFHWKQRHFDPRESDPTKWEVEDHGLAISARGGPIGPDSISLGTVEVPDDVDVDVMSCGSVKIIRRDRTRYPGVPSIGCGAGLLHFADAYNILDIAARTDLFGDLGITLVADRRPEVTSCR